MGKNNMHTFKWKTTKHPDGTKTLRGIKDDKIIDIIQLSSGRWSYVLRYDGFDYMPSVALGTVTTWATKQLAKSEGVIKIASYQKASE